MLGKKKVAGLLAITALLAACGGGGGGDDEATLPGTGGTPRGEAPVDGAPADTGAPATDNTTQPPVTTDPVPDDTATPPVSGDPDPGTPLPDDDPVVPADQRLAGHLSIVANQLAFVKADRAYYNAIQLEELETGTGLLDAAAGGNGTEGMVTVAPSAIAPVAPIAALGLRVDRFVQRSDTETAIANQTVVGRIALNLVELPDSPEIRAGEVAEQFSFVIDGVELSTGATGELAARVLTDSQVHVYGRTAAGNEIRESLPAGTQSVRLLPISEVLDHYGDTSSVVLLLDLEHAFAQAGSRLTGLELLSGHFSMDLTLSAADIVRPANGSLTDRTLSGKAITVNSQPAVNGAGISGTAWIRAYPPVN